MKENKNKKPVNNDIDQEEKNKIIKEKIIDDILLMVAVFAGVYIATKFF